MNIQNISSLPNYISTFLNYNLSKLNEIYDEGIKQDTIGILFLNCSQRDNKMDVSFLNESQIINYIQKESWENLKKSTDKKIFFIKDTDLNSIFITYL